jgi:FkbM family methyltransferase
MYEQPYQFVLNFFNGQKNLFFVDIGANDGLTWSNSLEIERQLEWQGIAIEPHPTIFQQLINNRKCKCINIAVSDVEAELDFFAIEGTWEANMLSGLLSNYCDRHKARVMDEYKRYNGVATTVKVKTRPLQDILDDNNISKIDYLSIDTEGSEIPILKSVNFEKTDITLISVEANYDRDPLDKILMPYGFKFIEKVACDAFYAKE